MKLKTEKCELLRAKVPFLGHIVTRDRIYVNPAKTKAVAEWPTPRRVKDVRSFIGLASYYRRFIPGFATIAAPLTEMYCDLKNTLVNWTPVRAAAFESLKTSLTSAPVLAYPSREEKFHLSCDASSTKGWKYKACRYCLCFEIAVTIPKEILRHKSRTVSCGVGSRKFPLLLAGTAF